jgi:F420-dependent oxidoreductase-like protein
MPFIGGKKLGKVKFGLRIPSFPVDGSSGEDFVSQIIRFVSEVECDFDSAWVCDHFHPWAKFVPETTPTIEGFTAISYFAGVFRRLKFGNIVLCNSYRNPALLAKMGATLQLLTGDRFILGIGAGWKEDEYLAYGYEFPSAKVRIEQLAEGVQIIRKMWTDTPASFEGKYYTIRDAICEPKPKPIPPIMIGGGGERLTLRIVAKYADWWNLANVSPETFKHKMDVLEGHCEKVGRRPEEIKKTLGNMVAIAETQREAREIALRSPFTGGGDLGKFVVGDPDSVVERLSEYVELGVEHFILRFLDFPGTDGAKMFAEKVIPEFS